MNKNIIDNIILGRDSVRSFIDKEVSQDIIFDILRIASKSPSGNNIQPWNVYVVKGDKKDEIIQAVCRVYDDICNNANLANEYQELFDYYPQKWFSPYIERRRANGWGLYNLLGIQKGENDKICLQQRKNYEFFGAPIGLFFTIHKDLGVGSKMDIAMFMQNIMLLARSRRLETCAQAAWNRFHKIVLPLLGASENEILVSAMALGYKDDKALINSFKTTREEVNIFTKFLGFN